MLTWWNAALYPPVEELVRWCFLDNVGSSLTRTPGFGGTIVSQSRVESDIFESNHQARVTTGKRIGVKAEKPRLNDVHWFGLSMYFNGLEPPPLPKKRELSIETGKRVMILIDIDAQRYTRIDLVTKENVSKTALKTSLVLKTYE